MVALLSTFSAAYYIKSREKARQRFFSDDSNITSNHPSRMQKHVFLGCIYTIYQTGKR
jgi:hypothetical protein